MFRNQYVVSSRQFDPRTLELSVYRVADLYIMSHAQAHVSLASVDGAQVAVIGEILDPFRPEATNQDIARQLARLGTSNAVFARVSELTGRFVCIYISEHERIALSDAVALRQIYSFEGEDGVVFGSSPKLLLTLLGLDPKTSPEKLEILRGSRFRARENAWLGDGGEDDRLAKVLPNHYLDLATSTIRRIPRLSLEIPSDEEEILVLAGEILVGGYEALSRRFRLLQPLTAGLDSRVLLAASRNLTERVDYYVFDRSSGNHADVTVPTALARRLGLEFRAITPEPLRSDFKEAFEAEHLYPRLLPKTEDIQHHWLRNRERNVVNVSTIGSEVTRGFYGFSGMRTRPEMLTLLSGYTRRDRYFVDEISHWLDGARATSEAEGVPVLDLFYWEQRLGNWAALYPFEQDIAIEEVSVFDNRLLLLALLRGKWTRRAPPEYPMFRNLVKQLWPEALDFPINPGENRIVGYLKRSTRLRAARVAMRLWFDEVRRAASN